MHFNLVYGRSGTGKSNFIYNDIKKKLEEDKEKKIFVIVPEQSNMSARDFIYARACPPQNRRL